MGNVFRKRGFGEAKKEQKKIEKRREEASSNLWRFFLKDSDVESDVPVRFLTEEPVLFYEHSVQENGKWNNVTCTGEGCQLCADGSKASHKGAWLIVDGREFEYTDKNNKKQTGSDQIRLYVRGATDIAKLDRLSSKYGLTTRPYFATKTGSGTSTSYELDRGDESELTTKELENLLAKLPGKYKKHADASDEETLYDIVEDCIFGDVIESESTTSNDEEEEEEKDIDEGVRSKSPIKKKKPLFKKK